MRVMVILGVLVAVVALTGGPGAPAGVATAAPSTPTAIDLGTLGGTFSSAFAVNADGQVVGCSTTAGDAAQHAFSWTEAGGMVDLGTLGGSSSYAFAVNASGQVVGCSSIAGDAAQHAFSWTEAGGMVDLGTLGGTFSWRHGGERQRPGRRLQQHRRRCRVPCVLVDAGGRDGRPRHPRRHLQRRLPR